MIAAILYLLLNHASVRAFKHAKTTNIERLKQVGRISRYTNRYNIIFSTGLVEFGYQITTVAIED